jgi:hypothetical protein
VDGKIGQPPETLVRSAAAWIRKGRLGFLVGGWGLRRGDVELSLLLAVVCR